MRCNLKKPGLPLLLISLLANACNGPESQLADLQHGFLEQFGSRESYEVTLEGQTLYLPLPASIPEGKQGEGAMERLRRKAEAIPDDKLPPAKKAQLELIRTVLREVTEHKGEGFFDPTRYQVFEALKTCQSARDLSVLLEKIPEYYRLVEERRQPMSDKVAEKAVEQCQQALDFLEKAEKNTDPAKLQAARASIKDYIGLCRSTYLE